VAWRGKSWGCVHLGIAPSSGRTHSSTIPRLKKYTASLSDGPAGRVVLNGLKEGDNLLIKCSNITQGSQHCVWPKQAKPFEVESSGAASGPQSNTWMPIHLFALLFFSPTFTTSKVSAIDVQPDVHGCLVIVSCANSALLRLNSSTASLRLFPSHPDPQLVAHRGPRKVPTLLPLLQLQNAAASAKPNHTHVSRHTRQRPECCRRSRRRQLTHWCWCLVCVAPSLLFGETELWVMESAAGSPCAKAQMHPTRRFGRDDGREGYMMWKAISPHCNC
jgi:hypothetical protein